MTTVIINPDQNQQKITAFKLCYSWLKLKNLEENNTEKQEIQLSKQPDVHILNGANQSSIGIDEIRDILHQLKYQPYQAPFQIGLILNAQALTIEAQNSLLKSLEEPGNKTEFVLTIQNEKQLLPTILSRSHKLFQNTEATNNNNANNQNNSKIITKVSKFLNCDLVDQLLAMETLVKKEKDEPNSIEEFIKNLLLQQQHQITEKIRSVSQNTKTENVLESRKILAKKLEPNIKNINIIYETRDHISSNANKRLALENLILKLEKSIM